MMIIANSVRAYDDLDIRWTLRRIEKNNGSDWQHWLAQQIRAKFKIPLRAEPEPPIGIVRVPLESLEEEGRRQ